MREILRLSSSTFIVEPLTLFVDLEKGGGFVHKIAPFPFRAIRTVYGRHLFAHAAEILLAALPVKQAVVHEKIGIRDFADIKSLFNEWKDFIPSFLKQGIR